MESNSSDVCKKLLSIFLFFSSTSHFIGRQSSAMPATYWTTGRHKPLVWLGCTQIGNGFNVRIFLLSFCSKTGPKMGQLHALHATTSSHALWGKLAMQSQGTS